MAADIQITPYDFAKALREIQDSGMSRAEIARTLNVPWSTVRNWCEGVQPSWHHGTAVILLHNDRVTKIYARPTTESS